MRQTFFLNSTKIAHKAFVFFTIALVLSILLVAILPNTLIHAQTNDNDREETNREQRDDSRRNRRRKPQFNYKKANVVSRLSVDRGTEHNSIFISWTSYRKNTSPIIIKRYSRPMSTPRLLRYGVKITQESLGPDETNYTDRGLPNGVYYYAVVTERELATTKLLYLKEGENYTHTPIIVYNRSGYTPPRKQAEKPPVFTPNTPNFTINNNFGRLEQKQPKCKEKACPQEQCNTRPCPIIKTCPITCPQVSPPPPPPPPPIKPCKEKECKPIIYEPKAPKIIVINPQETKPVTPKKDLRYASSLNTILGDTYHKGKFSSCIRKINKFLYNPKVDSDTHTKGTFFLGLCSYKKKSYKDAVRSFSAPRVRKKYPKIQNYIKKTSNSY